VTKLDRAVAVESTGFADQESRQFENDSAADQVEKSRRALQNAVRHFATVSAVVAPASGLLSTRCCETPSVDGSTWSSAGAWIGAALGPPTDLEHGFESARPQGPLPARSGQQPASSPGSSLAKSISNAIMKS